ncbi:MAG: PepSY-associated TM helix domain-containing protein [Steroidobacteraceae bacterium]
MRQEVAIEILGLMVIRKALFQVHWLVGITLGAVLCMSGITGGLMAFDKEIGNYLLGAHRLLPSQPNPLSIRELYARIHADHPERVVAALTVTEQHPTIVEFAEPSSVLRGITELNFGDDRNERWLVDPHTGQLLSQTAAAQNWQRFMAWLRQIHQGHWFPRTTIGQAIYNSVGIATAFLFFMALSGLYLRWPRGKALSGRAWFKIHWRLKGRPFLWNIHSVLGTLALVAYLISAHSGAFQNGTVSWYGKTVRALVGAPQPTPPGGSPPGGAGMGAGGMNGAANLKTTVAIPAVAPDISPLWNSFFAEVPAFQHAVLTVSRPPRLARFTYTPIDDLDAAAYVDIDIATATLAKHIHAGEAPSMSVADFIVTRNQDLHEGRVFGIAGVTLMMLASFAMPVFYVTGWMMYLKRRKRRAQV